MRTFTRKGITFHVEMDFEFDSKPSDWDCYTPKQVKAWEEDEWCFVRLVVRMDGSDEEATLWGVESGHYPITTEDDEVAEWKWLSPDEDPTYLDDLCDQVVAEVELSLGGLVRRLNAYSGFGLNAQV